MSDTLLDSLREKSGEIDLNCILQSSIGGYTKKSVIEYLSALKKQQQGLKDNYAAELQSALTEKDAAIKELDETRDRLRSAQSERDAFEAELSTLKESHDSLASDMNEALELINENEQTIAALRQDLEDERRHTAQSRSTSVAGGFMLDSARAKIDELSAELADRDAEIEALRRSEEELLRERPDEKLAEMRSEIDALLADAESLHSEIALREAELENRAARLETMSRQEAANRREIEDLRRKLQELNDRNEWIEAENEQLGIRLTEQMEQGIALCREISKLKATNSVLRTRKEDYSGYETEAVS